MSLIREIEVTNTPTVLVGNNVTVNSSVSDPLITRSGAPLSLDAWARPKSITDRSLISGMFTNSIIPASVFREWFNGTELTAFSNATSSSGLLNLEAGATLNDETVLDSFRSPRYEPNRGHLYSASVLLPSTTALGQRDFGMFTEENGAFFRLKSDGNLYACRRTTHNGSGTTTTEELIDLSPLGVGFDLSLGNIYDIQMQWRGVGNIKFFIGSPSLGYSVLVHTMDILGTLADLSIANPALPIAYGCTNLGANVVIQSGCVDITSEGGSDENHLYGSISVDNQSGQIAGSGFNVPMLVVRNKTQYNSLRNMRDIQALSIYAYSDQKAFVRVWATRDATAITLNDQVWRDAGDGFIEFIQYKNPGVGDPAVTTPMTFDTSKASLVFGARVDMDTTFFSTAQFDGKTEIHQSPGDIFIFTLHRENGGAQNGGITYEYGEEV